MIDDFKNWYNKKKGFINHLKHHNSLIIDRVSNVIDVLNIIAGYKDNEIDDDISIIFDCGYSYIYSVINEVEIYLDKYFDDNLHQFLNYEPLINYCFYVNELKDTLIEQESFNAEASKAFSEVVSEIEDILTYKKPYLDSKMEEFDAILLSTFVFKRDHLTTSEVFDRIAEEMEIIEDKKKYFAHLEEEARKEKLEHEHNHECDCGCHHEHEEGENPEDIYEGYSNTIKIDL